MKKILVIEDELALLNILKLKLEQDGYEVKTALSGKEGLDLFTMEKPDLVLLDVIMPNLGGFEVLGQLRKLPEFKKTKVIILTNSGREEEIQRGYQLGACDYMVKANFSLEELSDKIKKHL